ncbi:MAG TPA: polysaccharide deacetylase family protein [Pilimelia sp.]|nr:polysaccharide deacetylase family protein [Pilimelia sp.]
MVSTRSTGRSRRGGADPADGRTATTASTATLTAAVAPGAVSGQPAPGGGTANTLIVYDTTGPWGWLGEAYAMQTANLSSRFGRWTARPVGTYTAGELAGYSAVIYIGSTYDEPLPAAFLADVTATTKPVLWMYNNIWQLTAQDPAFAANRGFMWRQFDVSPVTGVRYRGTTLGRDPLNAAGLMDHVIHDPGKATVVGQAVRTDGTTLPWAVRSGNLTYLGEIPYAYVGHDDRYLAFADLLFDVLAPNTPTRRRALVRIEDVGPDADPAQLRAIADLLHARRIPFSVAVYTRYRNPRGVENNGRPEDYSLWQRPQVVSALKYMRARGGTLLMHGYTHQYESAINPYDGRSGNDFEFYMAHVDAQDRVIYDGPVPKDSASWATGRINSAATDFMLSGLPVPTIFEFPHYAGSAVDYRVVHQRFGKRYERGLYFPGVLSGKAIDYSKLTGQFFPYPVRDVFGSAIVPENIGNVEPEAYNHHPVRLPEHLIATARLNLVVRDGTASFFYHPYLGTGYLRQTVDGIRALGYTFVSADSMIGG